MYHYSRLDFSKIKYTKHKRPKKNEWVCSIPFAFDIETTSLFRIGDKWKAFDNRYPQVSDDYYTGCDKYSFCYIWQFGFMQDDIPTVVYGRTLEEFYTFITSLQEYLKCQIIIYVHNLSFEFQFLRNIFDDLEVFARKERQVMKCECHEKTIIFKCSYILSNMSLAAIGNNLTNTKKLVGDLDYTKIRFSDDTELTEQELAYCENDIIVLLEYLEIELKAVGKRIEHIPLTATSKIRRLLKKTYKGNRKYLEKMQRRVPNIEVYKVLNKTYTGATTHCNPLYTDFICNDLCCKDITSSYPYSLIAFKYPDSSFFPCTAKKIEDIDKKYCWCGKVTFKNIKSKLYMNYISSSKCVSLTNSINDNGKVYSADSLSIYITNIDFKIIGMAYKYEEYEINKCFIASQNFLDNGLRNMILELYSNKTNYKNVVGYEELYRTSKSLLNSVYGMCVTNLVGEVIEYDSDRWKKTGLTDELVTEQLDEQRTSKNTLLQYSTGVWCTAYSRYRLWEALIKLNYDVVYTDTDSVKYFGNYDDFFDKLNNATIEKLKNCGLTDEMLEKCHPKDINGIEQWLGVWDDEGKCDLISQGSKKYCTLKKGELAVTVAGLNKKLALTNPCLKSLNDFRVGLKFDSNMSGRLICHYMDNQEPLIIDGHTLNYKYGIVLQPTSYTLGHDKKYDNFLAMESLKYDKEIIDNWLEGEI